MEIDFLAWIGLVLRWLHMVAGIAWIGSSFYFIWLDNSLKQKDGEYGELWAVHGGGFYHKKKYMVAPPDLPDDLHWFKWEAYFTWISGFLLLALVYYWGAEVFLIDHNKVDFSRAEAILVGLAFLVGGWVIYDLLCRSRLGNNNGAFGIVWFFLLTGAAYALNELFSDRGAYIHMGALIGTVMVANVFMVIIPNQKKVVAKLKAGEVPDASLGQKAKQRSLHNNYMTPVVLFIMISNHYPLTYASEYNWLILALIGASTWFARHFFNLRHVGRASHWWMAASAVLLVAAVLFGSERQAESHADSHVRLDKKATFSAVSNIIQNHCIACHSSFPTHSDYDIAPLDVRFDSPEEIHRHGRKIYQQAVISNIMPLGNETHMTQQEREILGAWIKTLED